MNLVNIIFMSTLGLKNKAFTLIELLAIIVILAIIAVITVPIILNVIDNAKKGSIIDSAYGYKDAIDKFYFTKLMEEDFELDGLYTISNGKLMKELSELDIPFTGTGPTSGIMKYTDGELTRACLTLDDYKVTYDGSKFTSEKGTCLVTRQIAYTDEDNNVGYYNTEWIERNPVYYNPVTGESCTDYHEDNSKTGYNGVSGTGNQTSCLKWYAYSEQNGNVNLLLDHNTTATLAWNSSGSNTAGPSTDANQLLGKLQSDTSGWTGIPNRTDSYSMKVEKTSNSIDYTINYSGYKARIITAQEVAYIVGNMSWDETSTSSSGYFFDNHGTSSSSTCRSGNTSGCSYGWLYDRTRINCTKNGCLNNSDVQYSNYWTVSSRTSDSSRSWRVNYSGNLSYYNVNDDSNYGLRPVITVSKSSIFES